jgi:hypothetical protein
LFEGAAVGLDFLCQLADIFDGDGESQVLESAGELDLMVVDVLAEGSEAGDEDRALSRTKAGGRRANARVRYNDPGLADMAFELDGGQEVERDAARRHAAAASVLHDDALTPRCECASGVDQPVERQPKAANGDEDHRGEKKIEPQYLALPTSSVASDHWTYMRLAAGETSLPLKETPIRPEHSI